MKNFLAALLCFLSCYASAQYTVGNKEVDTTFNYRMNYIFGPLEKNRVPNGILRDYAFEFTNLENYDGTILADSNVVSKTSWKEIYYTLLTARVTAGAYTTMPDPEIVDSLLFNQRQPELITLTGLFYKYAYFKSDALTTNKLTLTNEQFHDRYVNSVWQNPYNEGMTIAFAPSTDHYTGKQFQIYLPQNLWFTNASAAVNHIEVDVQDGQGYRTITPGNGLSINYTGSGLKTWTFKLFLNNNTVLQTRTRIQIDTDPYFPETVGCTSCRIAGQQVSALTAGSVTRIGSSNSYNITSSETFGGKNAEGLITIKYAQGHTSLVKPLIVVEGFDPGIYLQPESWTGTYTLNTFLSSLASSGNLAQLLNGSAAQYDIVFLDYRNGVDDIKRNALLVKDVIRWVNNNKTGGNPNVVLGLSMGGLTARYALKKMEQASEAHQTRLFISHDTPHQGANVPLGYQYAVAHGNSLYLKAGIGSNLYKLVRLFFNGLPNVGGILSLTETPAAKQMLINRVSTNLLNNNVSVDNSLHNAWQTELTTLGYPTQCRNIAISNGSECGTSQLISPGGTLLSLNGNVKTSLLSDVIGMAAGPLLATVLWQPSFVLGVIPGKNQIKIDIAVNATAENGGNQVYKGKIDYTKKVLWLVPVTVNITNKSYNAASGGFPFDSFAGGQYTTTLNNVTSTSAWAKINIQINTAPSFGFVPTPSALDIGSSPINLTKSDYRVAYIGANPPPTPKKSPFANFIAAFYNGSNNEQHITYSPRNGNWFANELNNVPTTASCALLCNPAIDGNEVICGAKTFQLNNIPAGSTVAWSSSSNITINSSNQTSISITPAANVTTPVAATITAVITVPNCGTITVTKNCQIDYLSADITATARYNFDGSYNLSFEVPYSRYRTYEWKVNGAPVQASSRMVVQTGSCTSGPPYLLWTVYDVELTVTNGCDTRNICRRYTFKCNETPHLVLSGSCGVIEALRLSTTPEAQTATKTESLKYFPNPADNYLNVSVNTEQTSDMEDNSTESTNKIGYSVSKSFKYKIFDKKGKVWKEGSSAEGKDAQVNVADMPSDNYFLHIFIGDKVEKRQIIIKH